MTNKRVSTVLQYRQRLIVVLCLANLKCTSSSLPIQFQTTDGVALVIEWKDVYHQGRMVSAAIWAYKNASSESCLHEVTWGCRLSSHLAHLVLRMNRVLLVKYFVLVLQRIL